MATGGVDLVALLRSGEEAMFRLGRAGSAAEIINEMQGVVAAVAGHASSTKAVAALPDRSGTTASSDTITAHVANDDRSVMRANPHRIGRICARRSDSSNPVATNFASSPRLPPGPADQA